jgi:uncharacterized membrane protein YqiK
MKQINYEKPRTISVDDAVLAELRAENERLVIKANAEHIARQNAEAEADRLRAMCDEWQGRDALLCDLVADLWPRAAFTMTPRNRKGYEARMVELGIEVEL